MNRDQEYGTQVKNPMTRSGDIGHQGYRKCTHCQKFYTRIGISRHWGKCPKNPRNLQSTKDAK